MLLLMRDCSLTNELLGILHHFTSLSHCSAVLSIKTLSTERTIKDWISSSAVFDIVLFGIILILINSNNEEFPVYLKDSLRQYNLRDFNNFMTC